MHILKYPNFLIIGAGKSGTTSVYYYVRQHPQVFMTPIKEPNFFALEDFDISKIKIEERDLHNYIGSVFNIEEYKKLFDGVTDEIAVGESSTMYLYKPETHLRIKKYVPDVKMIAIFRDPASRLYSRYLHLARENRVPTENFSDCLNRSNIWWKRDDLVNEGFYYKHLSKYFEIFDKHQFKIFLMSDMRNDLNHLFKDLYGFLGVDENFIPKTDVTYNESGIIKNKFKNKFIGQNNIIKKTIQYVAPKTYEKLKKNPEIQEKVIKLRSKNLEHPKLDPELKKQITNEIYKEDILKLQDLIGRDLSHWLE